MFTVFIRPKPVDIDDAVVEEIEFLEDLDLFVLCGLGYLADEGVGGEMHFVDIGLFTFSK